MLCILVVINKLFVESHFKSFFESITDFKNITINSEQKQNNKFLYFNHVTTVKLISIFRVLLFF